MVLLAAGCGGGQEPTPAEPFAFAEVGRSSGLDLDLTAGGEQPGQILEVKGGGLALVDFDGDGDHDLFAPNGATLAAPAEGPGARLFENRGDLFFRDATVDAGLEFRRWGMGVSVGDVDGDGWDDLFVACFGPDALLHNRGGRFEERGAAAGLGDEGWGTGSALGDLDADGDLDLYLVRYLEFDPAAPPPSTRFLGVEVFDGPSGLTPQDDRLYLGDGAGGFVESSAELGTASVAPSYGLGALILDLDEDGFPEVFVGNDSMPNFLFRRGPESRYEDVGLESGVAVSADGEGQATMGIAYGDVNGDGRADLFTTNFMGDTNTLHVSTGRGLRFADRTQLYGLGMISRPFLGWAAMFYDLDHDGDEDLATFNGHVYPHLAVSAMGSSERQRPLVFAREGRGFARVPPATSPWLDDPRNDRSAVFGDLDGDFDVDIVVAERGGPVRLLRNDGAGGAGLVVRLADRRAGTKNPRGLGARLTLTDGATVQTRWITGGGSYLSASAPEAHFGLGDAPGPWTVEVRWPDGGLQELRVDRPGLWVAERED